MKFLLLGWLLLNAPLLAFGQPPASSAATLERVAFGSCNRHDLPQPIWKPVLAFQPQLWIWLGDNIYGDTESMVELEAKWQAQKVQPDYQRLRETSKILGVWDDHDYGVNDGGKDYPAKAASQQLFLNFLDAPAEDPRRKQEGIYGAETFGPPGQQVLVISLDVRTHRDPPRSGGDILGQAQWKWLEETLRTSKAQVHLIASGSQILPTEHRFEKWADYPEARERLLSLLTELALPNVIFLTGDRHHGEISRLDIDHQSILEITSSGMTHALSKNSREPNQLRVGEVVGVLNYGTLNLDWKEKIIRAALHNQSGQTLQEITAPFSTPK